MRSARNVSVGLAAGATLAVGACSLGALDGYATGGAATTGTGNSTGANGGANAGSSTTTADGGATSGGGMPTGASAAQSSTGTGTTTMPCTTCGASCVDTATDPANCGACSVACATGYSCLSGVCGNVVVDASSFLASCAVLKAGEVWCWGRDVWGEIGVPSTYSGNTACLNGDRCLTAPAKVAGVSGAVQVVAGRQATCALTAAGAVWCWGSNAAGLLGHSPSSDPSCLEGTGGTPPHGPCASTPTQVVFTPPVVVTQIAMGTVNACALTSTHQVFCWGSNASGQIASPPSAAVVGTPTQNTNVSGDVDQVVVSNDVSGVADAVCVRRTASHEVDCWGASASGTLFPAVSNPALCSAGTDDYCTPHSTAVPMVFTSPGGTLLTADAFSVGPLAGVALQGTKVFTWGSNYYGQGDLGSASAHFDPRQILATTPVTGVAAQGLDTLMLASDGTVWTLGWSDLGQIGNGKLSNGNCPNPTTTQGCADLPVQIPPASLSGVTRVIGGTFGSAAITGAGKLYMWGANYDASLGHAPSTMGDVNCGTPAAPAACADVPSVVTGLP